MLKRLFCTCLLLFCSLSSANPLPADEAFSFATKRIDPNTLTIQWHIKPGYFLYKNSIAVISEQDSKFHLGDIQYPEPQLKVNRQGQQFLVYRNQLTLTVPVLNENSGENLIESHFQGCSDDGFCYPPDVKQIKLSFNPQRELVNVSVEPQEDRIASNNPTTELVHLAQNANQAAQTDFNLLFSSSSSIWIMISFFGFGLLLAFTPCVLPMVPVLSSIIVGHGHDISTRKAFFLSLSYVLSMSITYGVIGAVIASLGSNLQVVMQSPWAIVSFSLVFVLLALSMFGLYELRLPQSWQAGLAKITRGQSNGHYLSAAIMGCMSTLILSPCVTAPLIGALTYIAQTGDMLLGLLSLFFLGLGMGTPLLLVGASAGKLLPKAGVWMNAVKTCFGVLLLGIAIYLISRLIPAALTMALWALLCIFSGVALNPFNSQKTNPLKQGLGIILLCYGVFILYGTSAGHTNPLKPLEAHQTRPQPASPVVVVKTINAAKQALAQAKQDNRPVLVDFYADWCVSCKILAQTTLQNKAVLNELQRVQLIQIDITENNQESHDLLSYFKIIAPPTFLFYDGQGRLLTQFNLVGEISAEVLLERLKKL